MDTSVDQLFKERDLTITPTTILEEPLTGIVILNVRFFPKGIFPSGNLTPLVANS